MTISYRATYAVDTLLVLTGCASREDAQQAPKLCSEVGYLNQHLQTLTNQAQRGWCKMSKISNRLTVSTLYPAAKTAADATKPVGSQ